MSPNRTFLRRLRLLPAAAALGAVALTAGCAGGIGETLSLGHGDQSRPVQAAAQQPAEAPVEPLAVTEPEPGIFDRTAYPNLNIIPAEPGGRLLTPAERTTVGQQLRERAAAIRRGDGPLIQHMRQQTDELRDRVSELTRNNEEASPACGVAGTPECTR